MTLIRGNANHIPLEDASVQCCITSPPYWGLRDYSLGDAGIGLEPTPQLYVANMVNVFREVWRVLRDDGTLWLNLGDSYAVGGNNKAHTGKTAHVAGSQGRCLTPTRRAPNGLKPKDLVGIPWRVAFALQEDGWYLRSDIIWHKTNPMPESVKDRPTKSHEYLFLLAKSKDYYYDSEAIKEPSITGDRIVRGSEGVVGILNSGRRPFGKANNSDRNDQGRIYEQGEWRNKRDVWTISTQPFRGAHFATFPEKLVEPCVLAGSKAGDIVLDPFCGSGTTGAVSLKHGRRFVGLELNPEYLKIAEARLSVCQPA